MCLAIPGKVKSIDKKTHHAKVSFNGIEKDVNIEVVDVKIGDYVVVHAGFAIEKLDQKEAEDTLKLFNELKNDKFPMSNVKSTTKLK